jgi:putative membrane protein
MIGEPGDRLLTSREERGDMGGMMGTAGAWIVLWIVLGVALLVTGGVVAARVLTTRRHAAPPPIRAEEPPGLQEARAALRMRYANGEISREDYLQGKVELED